MGHSGSKRNPMPEMEEGAEKVDEPSVGGDEDLGGGGLTLTGKKRKDVIGSADENGGTAKRVLNHDSMNLHVDAETADAHRAAIAEADRGGVLTVDTCNAEEDRELVRVIVSGAVEEAARCSQNNVEGSGVAVMEVAEGNGLESQGNDWESDDKREKADKKICSTTHDKQNESGVGTGVVSIDDSQSNKEANGPCQGEVIDPSATANDDELNMILSRSNPASGPEPIEQEGTVVCTIGDQKVENHCQNDDVHKEAEVSLIVNGRCTVDNHTTLNDSSNQEEGMDSPVSNAKGDSTPDIVFIRRKSITRKTCEAKQVKCEEEVRFEKRVTRSATVRKREVCASPGISSTDDTNLDSKDVLHQYKRKVSGTVRLKAHHTELAERGTDTKKQELKGNVTAQRYTGVSGNDDPANITQNKIPVTAIKNNFKSQPLTRSGSVVKKTEDAVSGVDQNVCSSAITERNDTELTDSEGVKSENKTAVRKLILSVGAKIVASKKRILESELDKAAGDSAVVMPSLKKARDTELEQPKKSSGEKLMGNNCSSDKKGIFTRQQHRNQTAELSRSVNGSNRKSCKLPQNDSDADETDSDTSFRKSYPRRTRSGASVALKKQEDSSESEAIVVRKTRQNGKVSGQKQRGGSTSRHPSGSSKTSRLDRSALATSPLSRQAQKGKIKAEGKRNEDKVSSVKTLSPSDLVNTGSLRGEKNKISEHIKGILLDAGWKIDLRPRNGRNYLDSVYIPPSGKGSYWSVTKAYSVFLENMESEQKDGGKSQGSSKKSVGSPGKVHIPEEILCKLKKNMVNRRRTKLELQKLRKKKNGLLKKFRSSKGKTREKKNRKLHLGSERKKRRGCALLARGSNKEGGSSTNGFVPYEWKRSIFSWLIDLDILCINARLKCMDESRSNVLLEGIITRDGINCSCCSKIFPVLEFVAHAGGEVSKPYGNVLVDGLDTDLLHCLINAWDKQTDSERQAFFSINTEGDDPNDDTCGICGDGGNLICCDGCPSTFHMSCLELEALPSDDWRCANCSCKFCEEHSSQGAQGTAEVDSSLRTCSQCEKRYHPTCSPDADITSSVSSQPGNLFCQQSCRLLFEELQNLLAMKKDLEPEFSCRVIQRIHEDVPEAILDLHERVECNSKLAVALSLMDECFLPIVDQRTGINLIRNVVYNCGSNFARMDFRGFYIFILERGDEIISAASVRIHGTKLAEMPFIGTRNMYRRQGMCRRLLDGIEMILGSLNVEKLIIPAIAELVDTWTSKFGFSPLDVSEKKEVKSISMLVFPGTGLLQKPLLKKTSPEELPCSQGVDASHVADEDSLCSVVNPKTQGSEVMDYGDNSKDAGSCKD